MYNDYGDDYRDARYRVANRFIEDKDLGTSGPGIYYYYVLAVLLVICAVAAAFILSSGTPHQQLATAPDHRSDTALPVTVPPPTSGLPSTGPGAATPSPPSPAAQE
jgi:hypothetical protein